MTASVARIVRHPVKAIGREELGSVALKAGCWMPFDRLWAVAHERSKLEGPGWARKVNFLRGVTDPALMAVTARLDEGGREVTLSHPKAGAITVRPETDEGEAALIDWLSGLWPVDLPRPTGVFRAEGAHLTDVPDPWISLNSTASLKALSQRAGVALSPHRFRGNFWIDGLTAWEEAEWIGRRVRLGGAVLEVQQQITRCKATMANPETGQRDVDTLELLNELGHQEFGVYAQVIEGGSVSVGDAAELLA